MFKKVILSLGVLSALVIVCGATSTVAVEKQAQAATVCSPYGCRGNLCCDVYGNPQCNIPWTPVGNPCGCFGVPGTGSVCPF